MYLIYGIKNCDTMKKAFSWLDQHHIEYQFHNYKTDGLDETLLDHLIALVGWQPLLNTKGMTWRKLDDNTKQQITDVNSAKKLMLQNASIIKRPLLIKDDKALLGFSESTYQTFTDINN